MFWHRFVLTRPSVLMNVMKPDFGLIALPPHSRQKVLACALFPCEQGHFTHAKGKAPQRFCAPMVLMHSLEIVAQLNDSDRIQGCVNVQISASGTSPVKPDDFGMRDVPKDIERLIVSRPYLIRVIAIISSKGLLCVITIC